MNRRQQIAYDTARPQLYNFDVLRTCHQDISLKGLYISTILSVEWIEGTFLWHASIAVLDKNGMKIPAKKVSKDKKERVYNYLEKMLEGVGVANIDVSDPDFEAFHLFRTLTEYELANLLNKFKLATAH